MRDETEQQQEKIEKRKDDYWLYLYVHCPNSLVQDWFLNDKWCMNWNIVVQLLWKVELFTIE